MISPSGSTVLVDGQPWTGTETDKNEPLRLELPAGQHEIKVTRDGFEAEVRQIAVRSNQTERIRAVLLAQVSAKERLEAETLEVGAFERCTISLQDMTKFPKALWSQGKQLFVNSHGQNGCWVEWQLAVAKEGKYHLDLLATQAPDYGKLQASLDGKSLPEIIDTYGASVQPLKPFRLGTFTLTAGKHPLRLTVVGKSEASTGPNFGIDAFDLIPAQ
jgi:hypothetical protein